MKTITVKEFLEATKDKQYKAVESGLHGIYSIIKGSDIPSTYNMKTIWKILKDKMGTYTLGYGQGFPEITLTELQ